MATPPDEDKETAKDIRRQQKKVLNGLLEAPLEADKKEMKQFLIREFTQESERVWARLLEDQLKPAFERIMDELVDLKYTKMKSHIEAHMERMMANYELRPSYDASGRVTSWAYVTKERHIPTPQQQQQSNRLMNLPAGFIFGGSGYQARMQQQSQAQQSQQRFYPTMNQRPSNAAPLQQQAFQQQAQGQVQFQGGNNLSSSQPQQQPTMNGNVDVRMQNVIQNRRPEITAVNGQSGSRYLMQLRLQQLQQVSQGGQAVVPNGNSYENNNNAAAALQAQRIQAARAQSSMGPQMISGQTQPIQQQMQPQQVQQRRPSAQQQQYASSGAMVNGHVQQSPVQSPHSQPPPPYPSSQGGSQQQRQPSPNAGGHRSPGFSGGQQQPMLHQQRFQAAPSANIIAAIPLNSQQGLPGQVILLNVSQQSSVQQPAPQQSANMPNTFAPQPAVTCNPLKYVNFKSSYTFASTAPSSPNTVSPSPTSRPGRSQSATTPTPTPAQPTEQSPTAQFQPTWYPSSLHTLLTSPTHATVSTTAVVTMASTPTTTSTSTSNESPIAAPSISPNSNNSALSSTLSMPSMNTLVQQQQHPPQPNNNTDNTVSLIPTSRENVFILGDSDILDILDDPFEAISPAAPAANGEQSSLAEDGVVVQNQNQEPEQTPQSEQNSNSVPTAPVQPPPPPPQSNGHANASDQATTSASISGTSSAPAAPANVVHIKTEVEEGITRVITKKPKRKKRKHANGQTHEMIQVKKERIEGEVEISGQQVVVQEQQQEVPQEQQAEDESDSDDDCQIVYIDDDFDASRLPFVPKEEPTEGINEVENVGQFGEGQQPQPEPAEQNNDNNMDELNLADLEYDFEVHGGDGNGNEALLVDAADQINGIEDGGLPELVDAGGQNVAEFNSSNDHQAQEQHNVQEYNIASSTSDRRSVPPTSSSSMAPRPSTSTSSLNISDSEPSSATRDRRTFIALRKSCRYLKCRELLPPEEVERHELEVHGMQKYPCRLAGCRKSFPENIEEGKEKQAKLYEHLEEKHNDLPKICCTVCLAPFPIIGSQPIKNVYKKYDNHIRSTHDKGEFRCNIAGCTDTTIFTILKDIERHLRAFHNSTLGKAGREG